MSNCPFCGAPQIGISHDKTKRQYACGSWLPGNKEDRTRDCYEAELTALKERLERAEGLLKELFGDIGLVDIAILLDKIQAFLTPPEPEGKADE